MPTGPDHTRRVSSADRFGVPDGTRLAAVSGTALYAWDVHSGQQFVGTVSPGDGGFTRAAFTSDGRFLATADSEGLAVWRLTDGGLRIFRAALTGSQARELTWDPGKHRVLRFLGGTTVRSYDLTARLAPRRQSTPADATVLSPDGVILATGSRSGDGYRLELRSTLPPLPASLERGDPHRPRPRTQHPLRPAHEHRRRTGAGLQPGRPGPRHQRPRAIAQHGAAAVHRVGRCRGTRSAPPWTRSEPQPARATTTAPRAGAEGVRGAGPAGGDQFTPCPC
jgi:hypothetical protein